VTAGPPFIFRCTQKFLFPTHSAKHAVSICVLPCALALWSSDKTPFRLFVSFYCIITPSLIPAPPPAANRYRGEHYYNYQVNTFEPAPEELPGRPSRAPVLDVGHAVEARRGFFGRYQGGEYQPSQQSPPGSDSRVKWVRPEVAIGLWYSAPPIHSYTLHSRRIPFIVNDRREAVRGFHGAGTGNNIRAGVGTNEKSVFLMDVMFE